MNRRIKIRHGLLLLTCTSIALAIGNIDTDGDGVNDDVDVCCQTPAELTVDAEGRPIGDYDLDCDVDVDDYAMFMLNFTGPLNSDGSCPLEPIAEEFLAAHNEVRAQISAGTFPGQPEAEPDLPSLVWDEALAAAAQSWSDNCFFQHDTFSNRTTSYVENGGLLDQGNFVGANLFASTALNTTPAAVVSVWVAEADNYDYAADTCSGVCGHYTQVVWADTTRVGCAKTHCPLLAPIGFQNADYYVCYYYAAGNFVGQRPYQTTP